MTNRREDIEGLVLEKTKFESVGAIGNCRKSELSDDELWKHSNFTIWGWRGQDYRNCLLYPWKRAMGEKNYMDQEPRNVIISTNNIFVVRNNDIIISGSWMTCQHDITIFNVNGIF